MKSLSAVRSLAAILLALLVAGAPVAAAAAPLVVESDRTDNGFSFTYDAAEGEMVDAASSIRFDKRDPVSFVINIHQNPKSDQPGERLRTRLSVGLNKDRVVRYKGTFWFEVTDAAGSIVYSDSRERKIVLRPRPGSRRSVMWFTFDVPSGSYDAAGYFERPAA